MECPNVHIVAERPSRGFPTDKETVSTAVSYAPGTRMDVIAHDQ